MLGNSYEIEVTALGEVVKQRLDNPFASYTAQFTTEPVIAPEEKEKIKAVAVKAFKVLNFKGYAKMSFKLSGGRIMLRRIATIPGFTEESVLPMLMCESGYCYTEALDRLVNLALDTCS